MDLNLPKSMYVGTALVWKRVAAFLIDIMIINFIVLIPFKSFISSLFPGNLSISKVYAELSTNSGILSIINALSMLVSIMVIAYFVLLESKFRQSIGKRLMRLYVKSKTKEIKTWQHLVRNIVFLPIFPFILLWLLDPLFMFFSGSKRRLSDILSKTEVIAK